MLVSLLVTLTQLQRGMRVFVLHWNLCFLSLLSKDCQTVSFPAVGPDHLLIHSKFLRVQSIC